MKKTVVDKMSTYFMNKGAVLNMAQYIKAKDGPISLPAIKRTCGSWARMVWICDRAYPDRMAIARASVPAQPIPEVSVVVDTSDSGGEAISAAEALARLQGASSE